MKRSIAILLAVCSFFLLVGDIAHSADKRIISPPKGRELILTHSVWDALSPSSPFSRIDQKLILNSYALGFWDALTLAELKSTRLVGIFSAYEGMDIDRIADAMAKFYQDYPEWKDLNPAIVMVYVIPRLKKGLPPIEVKNQKSPVPVLKPQAGGTLATHP